MAQSKNGSAMEEPEDSLSLLIGDDQRGGIKVFPNPTTGNLTVEVSNNEESDMTIIVFNMVGSKILEMKDENVLKKNYNIDLNNQADGMYIVRISSEGKTETKKIVLNR